MENKFDLIEKYLMNDMSVDEIREFEELLEQDAGLNREFLFRKGINDAILEEDIISLRKNLTEITSHKKNKILKYPYKTFAFAAVVILMISVSVIFLLPFKNDSDQLLHTYYKTYPALANIRSSENDTKSEIILKNAFDYYEEGKFNEASEGFLKILKPEYENPLAEFYLALCYLETDNLSVSEEYLTDLILKKDHLFWEQAHWYLAMLYLKQNRVEDAKALLEEIIKEDMGYKMKAKRILRKLN